MEIVVCTLAFLGVFFIYVCVMSGIDHFRSTKKAIIPPTPLSAIEQKKLNDYLELSDPWYPNHDRWLGLDPDDMMDLDYIKEVDPIEYIQIKLELWMLHQRMSESERNRKSRITHQLEIADYYARKAEVEYYESLQIPKEPILLTLKDNN